VARARSAPALVPHARPPGRLETRSVDYPVDLEKDLIVDGMVPSVERIIRDHVLPCFAQRA
jgi:hypothetical protein